jgi:hypothetical protein
MYYFQKTNAMACMVITLSLTGQVLAQAQSQSQRSASLIDLPYSSVFKDYQPYSEASLLDWKTSNQAVREAGGWRTYVKESQALDTPTPVKETPAKELEAKKP